MGRSGGDGSERLIRRFGAKRPPSTRSAILVDSHVEPPPGRETSEGGPTRVKLGDEAVARLIERRRLRGQWTNSLYFDPDGEVRIEIVRDRLCRDL